MFLRSANSFPVSKTSSDVFFLRKCTERSYRVSTNVQARTKGTWYNVTSSYQLQRRRPPFSPMIVQPLNVESLAQRSELRRKGGERQLAVALGLETRMEG